MCDIAVGRGIHNAITEARCDNEPGEQPKAFVPKHPHPLLFLGALLAFQDGADGPHEWDGDEPVVVRCGDGVCLGAHGGRGWRRGRQMKIGTESMILLLLRDK